MNSDQILRDIEKLITKSTSILITGQWNPDGDSIGSQLALYEIVMQHQQASGNANAVDMVIANDEMPPALYGFLPHVDEWVVPAEQITDRQFDLAFILDSSTDRIGQILPVVQRCRYTVNIDHHRTRSENTDTIAWVDPEKSSVAEMIYACLEHPAWRTTLTSDIATCLYAGIIYDTGTFRYPSTSARTLQIAATLVETGIDFSRIVEQVLLEKSRSAFQLFTLVLADLHWDSTGEIVWGSLPQELWQRVGAQQGDDEGLITQYTFIKEAKVAVLFKELSSGAIKVSFRTRGALDVGTFARTLHDKGGGHPRAAGCTLEGHLPEVEVEVVQALQRALAAQMRH